MAISEFDEFQNLASVCPCDHREDDRWYRGVDEIMIQDEDIGDGGPNHDAKA